MASKQAADGGVCWEARLIEGASIEARAKMQACGDIIIWRAAACGDELRFVRGGDALSGVCNGKYIAPQRIASSTASKRFLLISVSFLHLLAACVRAVLAAQKSKKRALKAAAAAAAAYLVARHSSAKSAINGSLYMLPLFKCGLTRQRRRLALPAAIP